MNLHAMNRTPMRDMGNETFVVFYDLCFVS